MARDKATQQNIDGSDLFNYPNKRIRNNSGAGDGTPVDESVYGDIHEFFAKSMRDSKTEYSGVPDNTTNGYQLYEAVMSLGGKNDMIKSLTKIDDSTVLIPIKLSALKQDEAILFKSTVKSTALIQSIRGSDGVAKQFLIQGQFDVGQTVRLVNNQNYIAAVGLYDSQLLPGLVQSITNINQTFANLTKILAVFVQNGAMLFWNKPANEIPAGWQEVVDWRGRFPVGFDASQEEFNSLGKMGGQKNKTLNINEMPRHSHTVGLGKERVGTGNRNGASANMQSNEFTTQTTETGQGTQFSILNPYRTVLFIEYVG